MGEQEDGQASHINSKVPNRAEAPRTVRASTLVVVLMRMALIGS